MASKNRILRNVNNQRSSLTNKLSNPHQRDQKRKFSTVPEMSPEARRATLLVREDTQVHNINSSKNGKAANSNISADSGFIPAVDTNNNNTTIQNLENGERNRTIKTSHSSRSPLTSLNQKSRASSRPPRPPNTGTSRSRSSISQNEPPFSMSDNELSSHFSTNTTSNASVYTSNLSSGNNNHNSSSRGNNHANSVTNLHGQSQEDDPDDDNDSALPTEDSFEDDEESSFQKNSFVLALDKALEKNDISRLKGDITDMAQASKPGTVRALNGGRLNNAQEVVVNVCYDDDKELVFHDDDDESIETFKAISQIRVNIWMEYNSRFPPDNDVSEFDPIAFEDDSLKKDMHVNKQRQPSAAPFRTRQKTFIANQRSQHGTTNTNTTAVKDNAPSVKSTTNNINNSDARTFKTNTKPPTYYNNTAQSKRTTSTQRLRNVTPSPTPSRHSSGTSSRGKVNSAHSSSTKPANLLGNRR